MRQNNRVPPHFYATICAILNNVLHQQWPLDRSYHQHFSRQKLSAQDQGLLVSITGEILRRLNYYQQLAGLTDVGARQAPAALLQAWFAAQGWPAPRVNNQAPAKAADYQSRINSLKNNAQVKDGCPDWLEQLGQSQLGKRWAQERAVLGQAPLRYIRVNRLKGTPEQLQKRLQAERIQSELLRQYPDALVIKGDAHLFRSACYREGWFEQQDLGSQQIARFLAPSSGMFTIDACAGTGGKSLHLAAMMANKGRLISMDIEQHKLEQLRQRARKAGVNNLETRLIESSTQIKRLKNSADRVLLDVPCSGLGVLRRNPEAKWFPQFNELTTLCQTQQDILQRYSKMAKVGGEVVYATCSILPQENEQQVARFLEQADGAFSLMAEMIISPAEHNSDGFYMAKLKREA